MNKKIGIIGAIIVIIIAIIIIICTSSGNSNSKFNEQFLEYEGNLTTDKFTDFLLFLTSNAEENCNDSDKLPTIVVDDDMVIEGGSIASLDISEYVSDISIVLDLVYEGEIDEDVISSISFEYSSDTNLINTVTIIWS